MPVICRIAVGAMATPARPVSSTHHRELLRLRKALAQGAGQAGALSRQNRKDLAAEVLVKAVASWKIHIEACPVRSEP